MAIFLVVLFLRFWQKLDFCFPASLLFYFPVFCFSAFCFSLLLLLCFFAWPIEEKRVRSLAWWFWWFIRAPPLPLHNHLGDLAFLLFYWNFLASGSYQPLLRLSIYQSIYLSIYIYIIQLLYIYIDVHFCNGTPYFFPLGKLKGQWRRLQRYQLWQMQKRYQVSRLGVRVAVMPF